MYKLVSNFLWVVIIKCLFLNNSAILFLKEILFVLKM